jgi:hypothetical protein
LQKAVGNFPRRAARLEISLGERRAWKSVPLLSGAPGNLSRPKGERAARLENFAAAGGERATRLRRAWKSFPR